MKPDSITSISSDRRKFLLTSAGAAALLAGSTTSLLIMSGCNVDWINTAINDLPTIVNVVGTVLAIVASVTTLNPAIGLAITTAATAAKVALAVVQQAVNDYKANPSATLLEKIKTTLLDVQANLGQILDAAHVVNLALRTVIIGATGLAITVLTQILSLLPANTTGAALAAQSKAAIKPLTSDQVKQQVNGFLNANGFGQFAIQ